MFLVLQKTLAVSLELIVFYLWGPLLWFVSMSGFAH